MVTIGVPLLTYRIYILDDQLRPVKHGQSGEICIGGPGVGLGYINRPDLTQSKFIDNPIPTELGGHSLAAARVISQLRQEPGLQGLSIGDLYTNPTIRRLAQFIEATMLPSAAEHAKRPGRRGLNHKSTQTCGFSAAAWHRCLQSMGWRCCSASPS